MADGRRNPLRSVLPILTLALFVMRLNKATKVYRQEAATGARPIEAVGTAVAAFVGLQPLKARFRKETTDEEETAATGNASAIEAPATDTRVDAPAFDTAVGIPVVVIEDEPATSEISAPPVQRTRRRTTGDADEAPGVPQ